MIKLSLFSLQKIEEDWMRVVYTLLESILDYSKEIDQTDCLKTLKSISIINARLHLLMTIRKKNVLNKENDIDNKISVN